MTVAALVGGVVAGVVAIGTWALLASCRRRWRNHRHFGRLSGRYRITKKVVKEPPVETASIRVKGSVLMVEYEALPNRDGSVTGEIAMMELFPRSGEGHYSDTRDGKQLWGFWELQVKDDDTLLVHTSYANHKTLALTVEGFVWTRVPWGDKRSVDSPGTDE